METAFQLINLVASVASLALALVAIALALDARKHADASARETDKTLQDIRSVSTQISKTVEGHMKTLTDTVTHMATSAIPRQPSQEDMLQAMMLQMIKDDPGTLADLIRGFKELGIPFQDQLPANHTGDE